MIGVRFRPGGRPKPIEAAPDPEGDYPDLEEFDKLFPEKRRSAGLNWRSLVKALATVLWPFALLVGCAAVMIARHPNTSGP